MDNLLFTLWKRPIARRQDFWLDRPTSGFGRLLAAVAIIGIGACLLDHASGKADTLVIASYASSQEGSFK